MRPSFRRATDGDLPAVMRMVGDVIAAMRAQGIDQWDEVYPSGATVAADIAAGTLTIAEDAGGRCVGAMVVNEQQDEVYKLVAWTLRHPRIAVVHRLMVSPAAEGQGIARALMAYAEATAKERGYGVIRLDAFTENPRAVRLYEQLGYQRVGQAPFRKGYFHCFEKAL